MTRIDCPLCGKMTSQLTHNVNGKAVGYQRRDGSRIFRCGWADCTQEDFTVDARGRVHAAPPPPAELDKAKLRRSLASWIQDNLGGKS